MSHESEILILGGGVCGLAAAADLGSRAIVLEADDRPGGLVQSERIGDYWFDRVLHLLHFPDHNIERRLKQLIGDILEPCPPDAWIECGAGTCRYPFQKNLAGLEFDTLVRCLYDYARASFSKKAEAPGNYYEILLQTFGRGMCDAFMFPYNRKMWKRNLTELAPTGFQWNIAVPGLGDVIRGAISSSKTPRAYNSNSWYPRPPAAAPLRGMGHLSMALAERTSDIRLEHVVESIDVERRTVIARHAGQSIEFGYRAHCLSTIPLPHAVGLCKQAPTGLRQRLKSLSAMRVQSVAICIRGPRPADTGLWRYYTDESLIFTRLVFMTAFDSLAAPADGFGILAEITERSEEMPMDEHELTEQVITDLGKAGYLGADYEVIATGVFVADPAYVVFTPDNRDAMADARQFLIDVGITPLGRYGHWQYSSMAQVIADGFEFARNYLHEPETPDRLQDEHDDGSAIRRSM